MDGVFKFFINALKAIILSPFYIVCFCFALIHGLLNHFIGETRVLFSGFKFASKQENSYTKQLGLKLKKINQGGVK